MTDSLKGRLLIASPDLGDPNFVRTVILICEHTPDGALGLVLNRPSDVRLEQVMPELDGAGFLQEPLRQGGPVQTDSIFILHDDEGGGGEEIADTVHFAADMGVLGHLLTRAGDDDAPSVRLYAGYAGWAGGQLEFEMSQDSWITTDVWAAGVLEAGGAEAWSDSLKRMGGRYALLAQRPLDPGLN